MAARESNVQRHNHKSISQFCPAYLNRWIQPDTIVPDPANPQSLNRYSYVNNNPVKYTDPSGHRIANGCEYEGCTGGWDESANDATPEELIAATEAYYQFRKDPDHFLNLLLDPSTFWQQGEAQALSNYAGHAFGRPMQVEDLILSAYPLGVRAQDIAHIFEGAFYLDEGSGHRAHCQAVGT